jgi:hypothetical protein
VVEELEKLIGGGIFLAHPTHAIRNGLLVERTDPTTYLLAVVKNTLEKDRRTGRKRNCNGSLVLAGDLHSIQAGELRKGESVKVLLDLGLDSDKEVVAESHRHDALFVEPLKNKGYVAYIILRDDKSLGGGIPGID